MMRRPKGVAGPALVLMTLLAFCGCDGSKPSDESAPEEVVSEISPDVPDQSCSKEAVLVDYEGRHTVYACLNRSLTWGLAVVIPFERFYPGEPIDVSLDDAALADANPHAYVSTTEYRESKSGNIRFGDRRFKMTRRWVSVSGEVVFDRISVRQGGVVAGSVKDVVLRPLDPGGRTIEREGEERTYAGFFDGAVVEGGFDRALITGVTPMSGGLGTEISVRGFNLSDNAILASFLGCGFSFPRRSISDNEVRFNVSGFCPDRHIAIRIEAEAYEYRTDAEYEFLEPLRYGRHLLAENGEQILSASYNRRTNNVYVMYDDLDRLIVYSVGEGKFLDALQLPKSPRAFDVNIEGDQIVVASADFHRSAVHFLKDDGATTETIEIPSGIEIKDIFAAPDGKVLVIYFSSGTRGLYLGHLDRSGKGVIPLDDLWPDASEQSAARFLIKDDRAAMATVTARSEDNVRIYAPGDDGEWRKLGSGSVSNSSSGEFHPIAKQVWFGGVMYDHGMSRIGIMSGMGRETAEAVAFTPDGTQFVQIMDHRFDIRDYFSGDAMVSSVPYEAEGESPPDSRRYAYVSDDMKGLVFIARHHLFHFDYRALAGWLVNVESDDKAQRSSEAHEPAKGPCAGDAVRDGGCGVEPVAGPRRGGPGSAPDPLPHPMQLLK